MNGQTVTPPPPRQAPEPQFERFTSNLVVRVAADMCLAGNWSIDETLAVLREELEELLEMTAVGRRRRMHLVRIDSGELK